MNRLLVAAAVALGAAISAGGASAATVSPSASGVASPALNDAVSPKATLVQRRGYRRGYRGPRYAGRRYYRRGYRRNGWRRAAPWIGLGIIGGLAAGAAARDGAYAAPADGAYALCAERFRSFNSATGTYTTYGGETRVCPYLR